MYFEDQHPTIMQMTPITMDIPPTVGKYSVKDPTIKNMIPKNAIQPEQQQPRPAVINELYGGRESSISANNIPSVEILNSFCTKHYLSTQSVLVEYADITRTYVAGPLSQPLTII